MKSWLVIAIMIIAAGCYPSSREDEKDIVEIRPIFSQITTPTATLTGIPTLTLAPTTGSPSAEPKSESAYPSCGEYHPDLTAITILFDAWWDGDSELYTIQADGGGLQPLTQNETDEIFPVWSPNGDQIAFARWIADRAVLFAMDASGSSEKQLTEEIEFIPYPNSISWAPNNAAIAFPGNGPPGLGIYIVDLTSGEANMISEKFGLKISPTDPVWSTNGEWIAFSGSTNELGIPQWLYLVPSDDSTSPIILRGEFGFYSEPKWNPTGEDLLFIGDRTIDIYNPLTNVQTRLFETWKDILEAEWSDHGGAIAFAVSTSDHSTEPASYKSELHGFFLKDSNDETIVAMEGLVLGLDWAGDGRTLLFTHMAEQGSAIDLYIVDLCSGEPVLLVEDILATSDPSFKP